MFSSRKSVERKLLSLSAEIAVLREEIQVVDEQLAHFEDAAEDARLRALVSETPQAEQHHRDAAATVAAFRRDRDHKKRKLEKLENKQDQALDLL